MLEKIRTLAYEWPGSGYRMIHDRLRTSGVVINHKRVLRLWHQAGLDRRPKNRRRRQRRSEIDVLTPTSQVNERWALDFLSDRLESGQPYRIVAVMDVHSRECVAIEAARSITAWRLVDVIDRAAARRGVPNMITVDNGPELTSNALRSWAAANGVVLRYSRPGKPTDNPFIESFNSRLRAECADLWWTQTIKEANELINDWKKRYNEDRTHRSLGRVTPASFAKTSQWIDFKLPVDRVAS